jgi:hypothetical protein
MTLSACFFYPLIVYLKTSTLYMQWSPTNTGELALSFLLLSSMLGFLLFLSESIRSGPASLGALALVCLIPFASLIGGLSRQLGLKAFLVNAAASLPSQPNLVIMIPGILLAGVCAWACRRHCRAGYRMLREALLIFSPLILLSGIEVARFGLKRQIVIETHTAQHASTPNGAMPKGRTKNIFVFLFDETSYDYLYQNSSILPDFPNIKAFSDMSENYHSALSAGPGTIPSIPGFLVGRRFNKLEERNGALWEVPASGEPQIADLESRNIFRSARENGYRTAAFGDFIPYCDSTFFGNSLDQCRSQGSYNHSAVQSGFSVLNPVLSAIISWPHQFPFSLLQNPVYCRFHRDTTNKLYQLSTESFGYEGPLFVFTHFGIPHFPFVFNGDSYKPARKPFLQNSENYIAQLRYVDHLFGKLITELKRKGRFEDSDIMFVSDHTYRAMAKKGEEEHVPLLLKRAGHAQRKDIRHPVKAEEVLKSLIPKGRPVGV